MVKTISTLNGIKLAECNYLGMGFRNYKSKKSGPILKDAAIELKIKVDSGSYTKIPVFFALVDYSGKTMMTKINYLGIEGGQNGYKLDKKLPFHCKPLIMPKKALIWEI